MAMVTIRLSAELKNRIDTLSAQSGRPMSYFIRELIERGIEEFEEDLRAQEVIREYLALGGRNQKRITAEQTRKQLGFTKMEVGTDRRVRKATKPLAESSVKKGSKKAQ
jgi:RHH-type transcriptional regulator, rel operon repressor / antitoxin RelB